MWEEEAAGRTLAAALEKLDRAIPEVLEGDGVRSAWPSAMRSGRSSCADAERLVRNYFALEDPGAVRVLGTELRLSVEHRHAHPVGHHRPARPRRRRGAGRHRLQDRPGAVDQREQSRLGGVHFYAFLCEQVLGRRPARVQLLHLREPLAISAVPSDQSIRGLRQQTLAVWARSSRPAPARTSVPDRAGSATTAPTTTTARQSAAT